MDIKKSLEDTIANVKDTVNETLHKSAAKAEETHREVEGDAMSPTDKIASVANQAKNTVAGAIDRAKIDARKDV